MPDPHGDRTAGRVEIGLAIRVPDRGALGSDRHRRGPVLGAAEDAAAWHPAANHSHVAGAFGPTGPRRIDRRRTGSGLAFALTHGRDTYETATIDPADPAGR